MANVVLTSSAAISPVTSWLPSDMQMAISQERNRPTLSRTSPRLRVFLSAPNINHDATGEAFVAWKWAEALSEIVDLTVFSLSIPNRAPLSETLPKANALSVPMPRAFARWPRFEAMAKPHYPAYYRAVRRHLRTARGEYDIAHQIMPLAARYPVPFTGTGLPYVIGPLGGTLPTPVAFRDEVRSAAWFTKARSLDALRFQYDPWLRRSLSGAALVLGVAPYIREQMTDVALQRFEPILELGVDGLPPLPDRGKRIRNVRLLHVGRGVRTKGLRDVVRALGRLRDSRPDLVLTSIGGGEDIEPCRAEAVELGVSDRVEFLGHLPRAEIDAHYAAADIFVFPSFREPTGGVLYEAMQWGLPVITAAYGGPNWIVDDETGIRIPVSDPDTYASDVARAITRLAGDPAERERLGLAGRAKLAREAFWPVKAERLAALYADVLFAAGELGER